jgi:DNA-binding response OmpR family regulator
MDDHVRKPRILVVEDDSSLLNVLCTFLSYSCFDVRGALGGEEAIALVNTFAPHLVVLDLNMRPVSGWEVLQWLREQELVPPLRVLVLTAVTAMTDRVRGLEEGAIDYMTKPAQPTVLVERIRSLLAIDDEQLIYLHQKRVREQRQALKRLIIPERDEFVY